MERHAWEGKRVEIFCWNSGSDIIIVSGIRVDRAVGTQTGDVFAGEIGQYLLIDGINLRVIWT